jgi:hypothetical protein
MTTATLSARRRVDVLSIGLRAAIVALTLATGWIHLGLGGLLFTLNAMGYAGLAVAFVAATSIGHPFVQRFSWLVRVGLAGYTLTTIVGWAIQGPYFSTAYIAKAIEVGILLLLAVEVTRRYGSPVQMVREALASVAPFLPGRMRDMASA